MTDQQILELANDYLEEWEADEDGRTWKEYSGTCEDILAFAQKIYEMGYNTTNSQIEIQKMLIDALEKNNKELMDAQMEYQVKVGQLEHQIEKLKGEIDYIGWGDLGEEE